MSFAPATFAGAAQIDPGDSDAMILDDNTHRTRAVRLFAQVYAPARAARMVLPLRDAQQRYAVAQLEVLSNWLAENAIAFGAAGYIEYAQRAAWAADAYARAAELVAGVATAMTRAEWESIR